MRWRVRRKLGGDPATIVLDLAGADARRFINDLATDDAVRRRVERDPRAALAGYGISVPAELVPDEVRLPTREQLQYLLPPSAAETSSGDPGEIFWEIWCPEPPGPVPDLWCLIWSVAFGAAALAHAEAARARSVSA
jgi:hypothetical protein